MSDGATPPIRIDIRDATRALARALSGLVAASGEPPATRILTLAASQECCRQAERAMEQLRIEAECEVVTGKESK